MKYVKKAAHTSIARIRAQFFTRFCMIQQNEIKLRKTTTKKSVFVRLRLYI